MATAATTSKTVSATEARVHLGEVLDDLVRGGDEVVIERNGEPVAVLMSIQQRDALARRNNAEALLARADRTRAMVARWLNGRPFPDADELIDGGRDDVD